MPDVQKQIRITGAKASGVRVFYAVDVPENLEDKPRSSRYLTAVSHARSGFFRRHPGARVLEVRLVSSQRGELGW